jgi:hypothetical protein
MQALKFKTKTRLIFNGILYRGYSISEIPSAFGFIYDENNDKDGITEWFNYKGLTWIME